MYSSPPAQFWLFNRVYNLTCIMGRPVRVTFLQKQGKRESSFIDLYSSRFHGVWTRSGQLRNFALASSRLIPGDYSKRQELFVFPPPFPYHHHRTLSFHQKFLCKDERKIHTSNLSPSSRAWLQRQQKDPYVQQAQKEGSPSRAMYKLQQMDTMVYDFYKAKIGMNNRKRVLGALLSKSDSMMEKGQETRKIQQPQGLFQQGQVVIELGASPGGWTLYASKRIGKKGLIIACDLLELDKLCAKNIQENSQLQVIYGDFTSADVKRQILLALQDWNSQQKLLKENALDPSIDYPHRIHGKVDCIMSDMAVNFTGDRSTDALRTLNLCEDALIFAIGHGRVDDDDCSILRKGGSFLCKFFPCGKTHENDFLQMAKRFFRYTTLLKPAASRKESSEIYLYAGDYLGIQ